MHNLVLLDSWLIRGLCFCNVDELGKWLKNELERHDLPRPFRGNATAMHDSIAILNN